MKPKKSRETPADPKRIQEWLDQGSTGVFTWMENENGLWFDMENGHAFLEFDEIDDRSRPIRITIEADNGPLTAKMLAEIPLGVVEMLANIRRQRPRGYPLTRTTVIVGREIVVPDERPYPDSFWSSVAAAYLELVAEGVRNPATHISEETGKPVASVRGWIAECRDRGLLPKGSQGRLG